MESIRVDSIRGSAPSRNGTLKKRNGIYDLGMVPGSAQTEFFYLAPAGSRFKDLAPYIYIHSKFALIIFKQMLDHI